jgi:hypothetical protein
MLLISYASYVLAPLILPLCIPSIYLLPFLHLHICSARFRFCCLLVFYSLLCGLAAGVTGLSGSSACRWYIDEDIPDINSFRKGYVFVCYTCLLFSVPLPRLSASFLDLVYSFLQPWRAVYSSVCLCPHGVRCHSSACLCRTC